MDVDDVYFDDGFELDADALQAIEKAEQESLRTFHKPSIPQDAMTRAPRLVEMKSVNKRLRTESGWVPTTRDPDIADIPDITIQKDGSYALGKQQIGISTSRRELWPAAARETPLSTILDNAVSAKKDLNVHPGSSHMNYSPAVNPADGGARSRLPNQSSLVESSRKLGTHATVLSRPYLDVPPRHAGKRAFEIQPAAQKSSSSNVTVEMANLNEQLQELQAKLSKAQNALQDARNISFEKAGENTILRQQLEKKAQENAQQIDQAKKMREAQEAKFQLIQKRHKDDLDRVKTANMFKRHELESSVRKTPWSVKRAGHGRSTPTGSVVVAPTQIRQWNEAEGQQKASPKRVSSPVTPRVRKSAVPETSFLGFENSFTPSPSKAPKATVHLKVPPDKPADPSSRALPEADREQAAAKLSFIETAKVLVPSTPMGAVHDDVFDTYDDMAMDMDTTQSPSAASDDMYHIDMAHEFTNFIMTFTTKSSRQSILQDLCSAQLSAEHIVAYTQACSNVFKALTPRSEAVVPEELYERVIRSLLALAEIFKNADAVQHLSNLFDLLAEIALLFHEAVSVMLVTIMSERDVNEPQLGLVLTDAVANHLAPGNAGPSAEAKHLKDDLARSVIWLLRNLALTSTDYIGERLAVFCRSFHNIETLLSRDPSITTSALQMLASLSTHSSLCQALLTPENVYESQKQVSDRRSLPLLESLAKFLADAAPFGTSMEEDARSVAIIDILWMISMSHDDAILAARESRTLIPSLAYYLTQLTSALWDEWEPQRTSEQQAFESADLLLRLLQLLHFVVYATDDPFDIRYKIHHASQRHFHSLMHMFIVAMGRLGLADPPEYLNKETRGRIERTLDLARDLLSTVVDGPDEEHIWTAYHDNEGSSDEVMMDDEEIQARFHDEDEDDS